MRCAMAICASLPRIVLGVARQQARQLHLDRRAAAARLAEDRVVARRPHERGNVYGTVMPEARVLGGDDRLEKVRRNRRRAAR